MPIAALIQIVAVVIVAGVLVWGLEQFPIDATFKQVAKVVIIVVVVIWVVLVLVSLLGGGGVLHWR
jgi:hypothetical protein